MIIQTKWNENYKFEATNSFDRVVEMDAHEATGGDDSAQSPMEVLLSALAGCMGINIIKILRMHKDEIKNFDTKIEGTRAEGDTRPYTDYYMTFTFEGDLPEKQVKRAVDLSHNKYCSVSHSLKGNQHVKVILNGEEI